MTNCSSFLSAGMSSIKTLLMHSTCPIYQNCARFHWQSVSNGISSLDGFTCTWMLQVPPGSTYLKKHMHTRLWPGRNWQLACPKECNQGGWRKQQNQCQGPFKSTPTSNSLCPQVVRESTVAEHMLSVVQPNAAL
jgi:hypothetical protein